jgi:hypothetical protein
MDREFIKKHIELQENYTKVLKKVNNCLECLLRYYKITDDPKLKMLMEEYGLFDKEE